MKNKLNNLVKINLKLYNLEKKIIIGAIIFSIIIYMVASKLLGTSYSYNININAWDGIFRVLSYSSLILGVYFPLILVITTFFNTKTNFTKFIMVRTNQKKTWVFSKIITNVIISFLFTSMFFIILIGINFLMLKVENTWSSFILSKESLELVSEVYANFFVFSLDPIEAVIISFLEILISSIIILNLRDLLVNYINKKYISYTIMSMYLIGSVIIDHYSLDDGIFKINQYIGLDTMSILFKHNFEGQGYFATSLGGSIMISLIIIFLIIGINILLSRRLNILND